MKEKIKKIVLGAIAVFIIGGFAFLFQYNIANATSGECSWHGGVNCAAGADWDGSAICNDGWKDSSESFFLQSNVLTISIVHLLNLNLY